MLLFFKAFKNKELRRLSANMVVVVSKEEEKK